MRSARRVSVACVATLPVAVILTGCVSTQQIAARARMVSARVLASQSATEVVRANPDVTVGRIAVIHARTGTAIVVSLRNDSSRTLTDLPISVGVHDARGRRLYLNRAANLDYFETHVAALGPRGATVWVFTTDRRTSGTRPYATVGFSELHPSLSGGLPRIEVSGREATSLSVTNLSTIPQFDVPVYVVAVRTGRDVAAGWAAVAHLGTHGRTTLSVALVGSDRKATLEVIAPPTIFS